MLLKSSSTSLIQPIFSESFNRDFDNKSIHHCTSKIKFIHCVSHLSSSSCNSSPAFISRKANFRKFVRRVQSDSNLEGLMSTTFEIEEVCRMEVEQNGSSNENSSTTLHSEPSFSIYTNTQNQDLKNDNELAIGDHSEAVDSCDFTFDKNMVLIEENDVEEEEEEEEEEEMEDEKIDRTSKLVENLKIGGGYRPDRPSLNLGGEGVVEDVDGNGDLREYYIRILEEEPSNPLFLRNYAQFLQSQGDLAGAEEYYYLATLADPTDGEILMQYAKQVWELHHDQEKASSYFERAVSAASGDSHVQAAYVRFLWEIEESEEEDDDSTANTRFPIGTHHSVAEDQQIPVSSPLHLAVVFGLDAPCFRDGCLAPSYEEGDIEDHYKMMIEKNPRDPLYLRNYAEFLYQTKGDLTMVDPNDGEIISHYAKFNWQVDHNKDKATTYFERAVQASPESSNVLGAYARFLWELEEDDEEQISLRNAGSNV